jgi:hypothetical protein
MKCWQQGTPLELSVLCFAKPPSAGGASSPLSIEKSETKNFYLPSADNLRFLANMERGKYHGTSISTERI